jgi:dimethylhistidine N-methyltransferase
MSAPLAKDAGAVRLHRAAPPADSFQDDVLAGLSRSPKELPCKYFYDAAGSALFEEICGLAEYYPTRTELGILDAHVGEMADCLGPDCLVVEYGCGSGRKTRLLLDRLERPAGYVPIDISPRPLLRFARALAAERPGLEVLPVLADYTSEYDLPAPARAPRRRVVYFPGSTIGNFHPREAESFLKRAAALCGRGGALLVGVDLPKPAAMLERAYDDLRGVTARFNLNLLARINRELGGDFDLAAFRHRSVWVRALSRVEMHLVSARAQRASVAGRTFAFAAGESICTEWSHKWSLGAFRAIAAAAGFSVRRVWTDPARWFSVQYLTVR